MRDSKDKFYRNLKLDEKTKEILKWYRNTKRDLINDKPQEEENEPQI